MPEKASLAGGQRGAEQLRHATLVPRLALLLAGGAVLGGCACDDDEPRAGPVVEGSAESSDDTASAAEVLEVPDGPSYPPSVAERDTCEILTAQGVSELFQIPADALRQTKMFGVCIYTWTGEGERLKVQLSNLTVHGDARGAALVFQGATSGSDAEFADVPGVGSAARIDRSSGDLTVVHGNLTFVVSAYRGAPMPSPGAMPGMDHLDEVAARWRRATISDRQAAGARVARAVLTSLGR